MNETNKPRIFSTKQILLTLILAGPLPAGYILASNYQSRGKIKHSRLVRFLGYVAELTGIAAVMFVAERLLPGEGSPDESGVLGSIYIVLLFLAFHSVLSGIFWLFRQRFFGSGLFEVMQEKDALYSDLKLLPYILMGIAIIAYLLVAGPFWFLFTFIYILPNLYLYNHIKKVFKRRKYKHIFTVFFILLVILFPVGEALEHSNLNGFASASLWIGYYYLPVLLYMFLLYLVFDIVKLVNRITHTSSKDTLGTKRARWIALSVILSGTVIITGLGIYNFNNTRINTYTVQVNKMETSLDELTIALAADFHFSNRTSNAFVRQFVKKLNAAKPDLVLLAGDLIETKPAKEKKRFIQDQLKQINSTYGVFAVEGNHELYGDNGKLSFFEPTNITFLRDTVVKIDDAFYLVGRKDRHNGNRKLLDEILENVSDNLPTVVMDHQPYELEKASRQKIDVQVSGHTHHGQLFPFHWITEAIYRISWGHEEINKTHFFVTCGAQGWGPPVKTSSHSEIIEINVEFK